MDHTRWAAATVAALTAGLLATAPNPAAATLAGGTFEGSDGNLVVDSGTDWESYAGRVVVGEDRPSGTGDNSLGQGSKDDDTTFTVTSGAIPSNKSDLDRFYVATENVGPFPGDDMLYLAWTRTKTLGSANFSFELNRLPSDPPPASGTWTVVRLAGDLLVLFDFARGGARATIGVSSWQTQGDPKQVCQASNAVPCWAPVRVLDASLSEAAVNTVAVTDPLDGGRSLPEMTFGESAINLTDSGLLPDLCAGFSRASVRSRASAAFNSELKDFIEPVPVSIVRSPDPTTASASGRASALTVDAPTVLGADGAIVLPDPPGEPVRSSQRGPGSSSNSASQLDAAVPDDGSIAAAQVLRAATSSGVSSSSGAVQTSTTEVDGLNLLGGLVTADTVRGVAQTTATSRSSGFSSAGSTFQNLVVNGVPVLDVAHNTRIDLPEAAYGPGSYVGLYVLGPDETLRTGRTSRPAVGTAGTYSADLEVTMVRVYVSDDNGALPGGNPVEVSVSRSVAHSEFAGIRCAGPSVAGRAYVVGERTQPDLVPATVGYVAIPATGGHQHQQLAAIARPGELVSVAGAESDSAGTLTETGGTADSWATVEDACVLPAETGCVVSATTLKARSTSRADATGAAADSADTAVVARVLDQPLLAKAPNTVELLPGIGYVVFNEQVCEGGAALATGCAGTDSAGLTVRALHVVVTIADNPLGLPVGADVVVAEAYSAATAA